MTLKSNADELALIAQETGAEVIQGRGGQVCLEGIRFVAVAVI